MGERFLPTLLTLNQYYEKNHIANVIIRKISRKSKQQYYKMFVSILFSALTHIIHKPTFAP